MCVIFVADQDVRPTDEMVRLGFQKNNSGGGAAWREKGKVRWAKGLNLEQMLEINKELPFPYVLHFRLPSNNTAVGPAACHPFPVSADVSYALKGVAPNGVVFHNGFWGDWKNKLIEAAIKGAWQLPGGPWTDSRGLALMAHRLGAGFLEFVDEKVVWFREDAIEVFGTTGGHNGWVEINKVLCSNRHWETPVTQTQFSGGATGGGRHSSGFTQGPSSHTDGKATTTAATEAGGGAPQDKTFRSEGASGEAEKEPHQQEKVQPGDEKVIRQGMAQQREIRMTTAGLILYAGEEACQDCKSAIARITVYDGTGGHTARCWDCDRREKWRKEREAAPAPQGTGYMDRGRGIISAVISRCQYCWVCDGRHVTIPENRVICNVCWLKQGRPRTKFLSPEDPRARATIQ